MSISKTGCSRSITKKDLDAAYKQGFVDCEKILSHRLKDAFLKGIEASKMIEWSREEEEVKRVCKEWGY